MSANLPEPVQVQETTGNGNPTPEPSLADEFREFGRQLSALLHAVREMPRAKEVEAQVTQAMRDMERQVTEAMEVTRQRVQEQKLKETLKGAAVTAADETQRGLARGLRMVNERLARAVEEAEKTGAPTPPQPASAPAGDEQSKPTDTHYDPGL